MSNVVVAGVDQVEYIFADKTTMLCHKSSNDTRQLRAMVLDSLQVVSHGYHVSNTLVQRYQRRNVWLIHRGDPKRFN